MPRRKEAFTAATLRHAAAAVEKRAGVMLAEAINLDARERHGGSKCRTVARRLQREADAPQRPGRCSRSGSNPVD